LARQGHLVLHLDMDAKALDEAGAAFSDEVDEWGKKNPLLQKLCQAKPVSEKNRAKALERCLHRDAGESDLAGCFPGDPFSSRAWLAHSSES
jgi:hypothetical protein